MPTITASDGIRLHYEDDGDGAPVVLVHGWSASSRVWDPAVRALAASHRVLRPDLRGCGASQTKEGTLSFDHYASDLHRLVDGLGLERTVLVGWSLGVGVIHRYLQMHGTDGVAGAVLIDYPVKLQEKRDVADKVCHQLNKRRDAFLESFVARMFLDEGAEGMALVLSQAKRVTRTVACQMYRAMGLASDPIEETFDLPALLVFPEHGWFPEALADWRQRFPEHDVVPFPKSRHAPVLEETDRFVQFLLEFMETATSVTPSRA